MAVNLQLVTRQMKFFRQMIISQRDERDNLVSHVIVLRLEGLIPEFVLRYSEEGLFQHLALLSDIGSRIESAGGAEGLESFRVALHRHGVHVSLLPAAPLPADATLDDICAADQLQQERLVAVLKGRCPRVVACEFNMAAQLSRLYGTPLNAEQQLVMRDVYARMDEIVGKALSFLDDRTAIVVVLHAADAQIEPGKSKCLVFASCRLEPTFVEHADLAEIVLRLLNCEPAA